MKTKKGHVPMRVLHVAEILAGGVASYLEELLPMQIDAYGIENVLVVAPESQLQHVKKLPGRVIRAYPDSRHRALNALTMLGSVVDALHHGRPSVVHLHSSLAGLSVRPLLKLINPSDARVVYCPHGLAFNRDAGATSNFMARMVESFWARMCDAVICVSRHEYDSARQSGLSPAVLDLVYDGMSSHIPEPGFALDRSDDSRLRLLFIGRLDRQKGADLFVQALTGLGEQACGIVVGDASVDAQEMPPCPDNVRFVGWQQRDALTAYYRWADALVMPSRWEAFGLVAVEAMRCGVPVLAASVGGLREVVEHGVSGMLFPKNDVGAIVELIHALDRQSLERLGAAGKERFMRVFSAERMFAEMDALYRSLMPGGEEWSVEPSLR